MQAILIEAPGGPEQLKLGTWPTPEPAPHEVLVKIGATALNRADLMQREGRYDPPEGTTPVLGLEMAGTVVDVGSEVTRWRKSDRICGLLPGGGYAEYVTLHEDMALPVPDEWTFEQAAAVPEVFLTAYQALYWLGELQEKQSVLIHAGGSGVGTAAIQMARHTGARVFATASAKKHERCLSLGAEAAIDYRTEAFDERVLDLTDGRGVDVVIDFVGAPYLKQNITSLAVDGRLVLLAMMGGYKVEALNLVPFFRKRLQVIASTLRNRSEAYKIRLTREFAVAMWPHFRTGELEPVIDSVYDWRDVVAAHRHMETNSNSGKIVLRVTG